VRSRLDREASRAWRSAVDGTLSASLSPSLPSFWSCCVVADNVRSYVALDGECSESRFIAVVDDGVVAAAISIRRTVG